jgi:hypothetical protein
MISDRCLADFAGYGACIKEKGHPGRHLDANSYSFGSMTYTAADLGRKPKHELARIHVQQGGLMGLAVYLKWRKDELVTTILECQQVSA